VRWPFRRKLADEGAAPAHEPEAQPSAPPRIVESATTEVLGDEQVTTTRYEVAATDVGLTVTITGPAPDTTRYVAWDWPRSADDPTGPANPPTAALAIAPDLAVVLAAVPEPELPTPRRDDWPVDAMLAELRMTDPDEWGDVDTEHVRAAITSDVDAYLRSLIDRYRGLWYQLTRHRTLQVRFPAFVTDLAERHRADPRFTSKRDAHRTKWLEHACTVGLWDVYRTRHPWPDYTGQDCVVCGRRFPPESCFGAELSFGPPIACKSCNRRALFGHQLATVDVRGMVKSLADVLGFPPPSAFRARRDAFAVSARRAELMALLVALPDAATCGEALGIEPGRSRWLQVLHAAGVVGEAWKMPRGIMTIAADGHLCRSFGELAVEKHLIANGIDHQCEPTYPAHPALNPTGKQRADWLLPGDRWVEYAGLMDEEEYATKMAAKVELAAACGLDLLVLTPDDLPRLGDVLAPHG
jgi:hypothetical protein